MKHIKRFLENSHIDDIKEDIYYMFRPLSDNTSAKFTLKEYFGKIEIVVFCSDGYKGFSDDEKKEIRYILESLQRWCEQNDASIGIESSVESYETQIICPECGSLDIDSSGYDYDSGRCFSECRDCEYNSDDRDFENNHIKFNTFESLNRLIFEKIAFSFEIIIELY